MAGMIRHRLQFFHRRCAPESPRPVANIVFGLVDERHFPWDRHASTGHFPAYRGRFRDGGRCMIGIADDTVVFTAWIACRSLRIDELRRDWRIPEASAVVYDVVTIPAWRGKGVYPEALRRIAGALSGEGIRDMWIYAEAENTASRRGILKAGFVPRGEVSCVGFAGFSFGRAMSGNIPGLQPSRGGKPAGRQGTETDGGRA